MGVLLKCVQARPAPLVVEKGQGAGLFFQKLDQLGGRAAQFGGLRGSVPSPSRQARRVLRPAGRESRRARG